MAGQIEVSRRRDALGWSIHKEVAALPAGKQERLLAKAEALEWTVRDKRRAVTRLLLLRGNRDGRRWQQKRVFERDHQRYSLSG